MSKIDTLAAKAQTGLARLRDEDETGAVLDDVPAWAIWTAAGVAVALAITAAITAWAPGWIQGILGGL